jgi:hypothetical protein
MIQNQLTAYVQIPFAGLFCREESQTAQRMCEQRVIDGIAKRH